jgi:LytS/YehU family sensor histidine kinase
LTAQAGEQIVPMALQVLVENAVKHNEATSTKPLKITLKREGDNILVSNNLQLKANAEDSTKTGLTYLKERYEYMGKKIVVVQNDEVFTVELPIIKLQD